LAIVLARFNCNLPQVYVNGTVFAVWEALGRGLMIALTTFSVERRIKYLGPGKAQRFCHVRTFSFFVGQFGIVQQRQNSPLWLSFSSLTSPI